MGKQTGLGGGTWQVVGKAVYFISEAADKPGQAWLFRYDRGNGTIETLTDAGRSSTRIGNVTVDVTGTQLFFDRLDRWSSDVYFADLEILNQAALE